MYQSGTPIPFHRTTDPRSGVAARPATRDARRTDPGGRRLRHTPVLVLTVLLLLAPTPVLAQQDDEDLPRMTNAAELSFIISGGNSGSSTLGIRDTFRWIAEAWDLKVHASAIRTDATRATRFAEGTGPDDFVVREETETERSAERYAAEARYDRNVSEHFFTFGGLGWARNTFAGFNNRTIASLGAGNQWGPGEEDWFLKFAYGVTYTNQVDVERDPDVPRSFIGGRLTLSYLRQLTEGTSAELEWVVDANAEREEDLRGDFTQAVSAALNNYLSLKTTLQLLWDNDPPLERVPLSLPGGDPTGEEVRVPFEELDYNLSVALVVTL